jgi:flagellar basal-body rod modification protein FlgD
MSSYIPGLNQAATATAQSQTSEASNRDDIMGKEDFLTLLVAQLQNQDPLNPDDPTEFTAQLAQFSSLEQLFNLNDSMDNLVQSNANSDRLSTLNTIGKEVSYRSSTVNYSGEPVVIGYELDGVASDVTIALQMDGATVATLQGRELGEGIHYLSWDGMANNGQPAPVGEYRIVIGAKAAEGESVGTNTVVRSMVTGVDLDGEYGGTLITNSGEVGFNTILGVYDPGTFGKEAEENQESSQEDVNNSETLTDTENVNGESDSSSETSEESVTV